MTTRSLGGQIVMIGTLIALLDKYYPSAEIEQHILKGIGRAKSILAQADIAADRGFATTDVDLLAEKIDILTQSVGVYLQPEWAAKEGTDKNLSVRSSTIASHTGIVVNYGVPAGKTLYITQITFYCWGSDAADKEKDQMCWTYIYDNDGLAYRWFMGGNGGGGISLSKPMVFDTGNNINIGIINESGHNVDLGVLACGYEV